MDINAFTQLSIIVPLTISFIFVLLYTAAVYWVTPVEEEGHL